MVDVRPWTEIQDIEDPCFLRVHTFPKPTDPIERLATIELVEDGSKDSTYTKLVDRQPMTHEYAMAYARQFAEKYEVRVIYERMDPDR